MTARSPLYYNGTILREMSSVEIVEWQTRAIYEYSQQPTANVTFTASGGNTGNMDDTRTQAGAYSTSVSAFPSEAVTAEPSTVTVTYDKMILNYTGSGLIGQTTDSGTSYPVYYDNATGAIRAMPIADLLDTFIHPAIDLMVAAAESNTTAGTYTISTSTSIAGYTEVSGSATPIFTDTRADTTLYSAAGIPETLDQPQTITNYYLHRRNGVSSSPTRNLMFVNGSNNIQEFSEAAGATLLGDWLRYTAAHSTAGYKISYATATSGSGNVRGTNMVDTKLDGTGNYQTLQVGLDDYRAQEFPDGTAQIINTYNLRIVKV